MTQARYIDTAETAKIIRKRLKAEFPTAKFSVRISRYSGGSSISVCWTDGPTNDAVKAVVGDYYGSSFDGMIDMSYSIDDWLMPDGSTTPAKSSGTAGSMGSVEGFDNPKPHPDAELVRFANASPDLSRTISDSMIAATKSAYTQLSPNERFKLHDKAETHRRVWRAPDSYCLNDALMSDWPDPDEAFRVIAMSLPA